jgi:hypothetical protein
MSTIKLPEPPMLEDFIKSMEQMGLTVTHGEPLELIWRLATTLDRELDAAHERIAELERLLGV